MDINDELKSIPFGKSQFQITHFDVKESPERTYRHILLQLDQKNQAMQECVFRRRRKEVDIAEIHRKLKKAKGFQKQRLEIDLEEAEYHLDHEIKFIEDCAIEIATCEAILAKLPKYTREQFESAELEYWQTKFLKLAQREIEAIGMVKIETREALEQLGIKIKRDKDGKHLITGNIVNKKLLSDGKENLN